ncbi:unnamed protein product, partial [Polarella glacialis]
AAMPLSVPLPVEAYGVWLLIYFSRCGEWSMSQMRSSTAPPSYRLKLRGRCLRCLPCWMTRLMGR